MTTTVTFSDSMVPIHKIRSRQKVLLLLLPKFLGILWEHGSAGGLVSGTAAYVGDYLQIGAYPLENFFVLHAFTIEDPQDFNPRNMRGVLKVFSAYLRPEAMNNAAVPPHLGRIILFLRTDLCIHQLGALEELGLSRTWHQYRYSDARIFQLFAQRI